MASFTAAAPRSVHAGARSSPAALTNNNAPKAPAAQHYASPARASRLVARAHRATWLPGLDPPPHLDGTLVGDFGFDPLGLGEDPASLKWYVQAELVHSRFAMAGVAGILVTDS